MYLGFSFERLSFHCLNFCVLHLNCDAHHKTRHSFPLWLKDDGMFVNPSPVLSLIQDWNTTPPLSCGRTSHIVASFMGEEATQVFEGLPEGAELRLCVTVMRYDVLLRPLNWVLGGAWRVWALLMFGVHAADDFVMHVHQLQVLVVVPVSFVALPSIANSARGFGNCCGWRSGLEGHYVCRRRPSAIWTELPFITEELIPAYRGKWRRTLWERRWSQHSHYCSSAATTNRH